MVAIKDFEMPRYCVTCDICRSDDGENLYCGITHSDVIDLYHRQTDCPLVEAIPKDQYVARLKADMVAMLEDLRLDFQEAELAGVLDNKELIFADEVDDLVQQKINSLEGEQDPTPQI